MLEEGESSAAMNLLKQLRSAIPDDIALRQLQAQVLITENKTAEALQLLQELSPVIREYPAYYEVMAAAAQKSANYPLAMQTYQRLLLTDSRRGDWWAGMAIALDANQQSQRASEAFRKALADTRLAPALRQYSRQRLGQPVSASSTNPLSNQ
jgi:MSHA biogenesis protein MshN